MAETCVWCGALAIKTRHGIEWVVTPAMDVEHEHELIEHPPAEKSDG